MVYAKVGDASMVYIGDDNVTPDRHLGAAQIDPQELDLVITESTYAMTVRDSIYARERVSESCQSPEFWGIFSKWVLSQLCPTESYMFAAAVAWKTAQGWLWRSFLQSETVFQK
ncbi:unnamed protein product [Linum tenue]|uniref:Uncharacterized protein n=1 Tax=Linum tenue TaxID=586396 RepID=A0AAV0M7J8_9ROSI|nr:unnamed protein product [Linum tenue]